MTITTASSTHSNKVLNKKEFRFYAMSTDVYLAISSEAYSAKDIDSDIEHIKKMFSEFEQQCSRFIPNNKLAHLNQSTRYTASGDLLALLHLSKTYYAKTTGVFDPTILNALVSEGYNASKEYGFTSHPTQPEKNSDGNFDDVRIENGVVTKPEYIKIDFGGIGKGYIVDKASRYLADIYENFCVDAGGDMYVSGTDDFQGYAYWAIEIASDFPDAPETPTLIISNQAIATSGILKRQWTKEKKQKHHLIDPSTHHSVENDIISVTVISENAVEADVWAKTVLILGSEKGLQFCEKEAIPAVMILKDNRVIITEAGEKYVWKE